ncbi:hypothetical protein H257_06298 [Aphanomyces astaci]|uniref:Kinesin-like protein n=2 Tax=Aphanomyces astaci TaxID=112090 RepID=W4GMA4_APHAT|nr:hypothetical protein H257_06298 [Aphanomyces astaci]ETV80835.1 hypothetical protein H257_06298 [Aphanomyces astaci]|eukprot:XP_009829782.1 hypothetical protein H257_06298 [Aphanomyces astaci]
MPTSQTVPRPPHLRSGSHVNLSPLPSNHNSNNLREAFVVDSTAAASPKQRSTGQPSPKTNHRGHTMPLSIQGGDHPFGPPRDSMTNNHIHPETNADDTEEDTDAFKRAMWAGQANILVAVRLRPQLKHDRDRGEIVKVLGNKVVVVLDPGNHKDVVGKLRHRSREKRYAFDYVFSPSDGQATVYNNTTKFLIHGILQGFNATVFAYGCTGAGKTYTMLGTPDEPGIMALTLDDLFGHIEASQCKVPNLVQYRVTVSFLEVYNENIRDLLRSDHDQDTYLDLREDPVKGPVVADLSEIVASNAEEVMRLLRRGNKNRSQEATAANAVSSRSHAVLQVSVEQTEATPDTVTVLKTGKLSMIDLAGSERAAVTQNRGLRLLEGANINRSLLALGNCINALGEKANRGAFVPYRDSKLTRLLKDSLGGNCRTVMIANISMSVLSFEETVNTLKYANRAKNIKTTVTRNVLNVNHHISEYVSLIANLRQEITNLKAQMTQQGIPSPSSHDLKGKGFKKDLDESNNSAGEGGGTATMREARVQIMKYFHERMLLRRQLLELENKNVAKSIEIGQHQLVVAEHERQREEKDEDKAAAVDARVEFEEFDDEADMVVAKMEIGRLQDDIKDLSTEKGELTRKLRLTERVAEEFRAALEHTITNDEKRELLLMEYRIGKLELENMELEQTRTVQETISRGKDLTVEKLKLQLRLRDKIIQKQQAILDKHDIGHEVRFGILDTLEDATLTDGFDTLRLSMERISSPVALARPAEADRGGVVLPDIFKQPSFVMEEDPVKSPVGRMSLLQWQNQLDKAVPLKDSTMKGPAVDTSLLPSIISRHKKKSAPGLSAPYLKVLKHRRKRKSSVKPIASSQPSPHPQPPCQPNF